MARKLIVEIVGDASNLERSFKQAGRESESFGRKVVKASAIAGAAIAGTAIVLGKKFADAAIAAEEETGKLNLAFENAGLSAGKMTAFVNKTEAAQRKLGFTNSETRDALAKFVTAGDKGKDILRDLALASDFARFKNMGLADASLVLVRAHAGNMRALKSLGISMKPVTINMDKLKEAHKKSKKPIEDWEKAIARNADASLTYEAVVQKLQKMIGGQAKEFSKSAKGGMEQFHAQIHNLEERIGSKLLPVISKAIDLLNDLTDIFTGSGSASQKFEKALERIGISAKTSKRIIDDLKETFNFLKTAVVTAFTIIRPILEAFRSQIKSIVQLVDDLIHGRWSKIWGDAVTVVRKTVGLWKTVLITAIKTLGGIALRIGKAIGAGILRGLAGLGNKIVAGLAAVLNPVIRIINKLPFVNIPLIGGGGSGGNAGSRQNAGGTVTPKGKPRGTTFQIPQPKGFTGGSLGASGIVPSIGVAAAAGARGVGGAMVINGPITVVANDPQAFIRGMQKQARRGSSSRSGPYGGFRLGLT